MNVVLLASGPFAIPTLERLHSLRDRWPLRAVVSRPDRPARRGRKLCPTPVRERAEALGIETWAPDTVNDPEFLDRLAPLDVDLCLVADYGEMLRAPLRRLARIGTYNLHGSLLPAWRGAAPVAHAILAGDERTGVTLFRIVKELDAGPVVAMKDTGIRCGETAGDLEERLAHLAADLVAEQLPAFAAGTIVESPQDDAAATFAPKIDKTMGRIDWTKCAARIAREVAAFHPWPLAYTHRLGGGRAERTMIHRARAVARDVAAAPGTVTRVERDEFEIACGEGALEVSEIQREGKRVTDTGAYLRGNALVVGDRFGDLPETENER